MQRFKFVIEYDGSRFFGWQRQQIEPTVQQVLEDALIFLVKHPVTVFVAGRTDTGVHATGQVGHADLNYSYEPYRLQASLNHFLNSKGVSIKACEIVDSTFHARASALYRYYEYRILNRFAPPVWETKVWHVIKPLNVYLMHEAAQFLIGTHDFSSFRDSDCQSKSPIKTLTTFDIVQKGEEITAYLKAQSFLHHQVRIMMGTLKEIGAGKLSLKDFREILDAKNRSKAGPTAPPQALTLTKVDY